MVVQEIRKKHERRVADSRREKEAPYTFAFVRRDDARLELGVNLVFFSIIYFAFPSRL